MENNDPTKLTPYCHDVLIASGFTTDKADGDQYYSKTLEDGSIINVKIEGCKFR